MRDVELALVRQRPVPQNPAAAANATNTTAASSNGSSSGGSGEKWVPWHLDRIDQRNLPLDGRFLASATGTGVNVGAAFGPSAFSIV